MPLKAFFLCAKPCVRSVLPRAVGITRHPLDELRNESLDDGFGDAERSEAGGGHRALRGLGELGRLDPGFEVSNGGELERAEKAPRRCQRGTLESRGFGARSIGVTHAALECLYCADVLARILVACIEGRGRGALLAKWEASLPANKVKSVAKASWRSKARDDIRSSGYVVNTLEGALWAVGESRSFGEAVLKAVNLGDDADTGREVAGQVAGAIWGSDRLLELAESLLSVAPR
jgi:hypothetical protein